MRRVTSRSEQLFQSVRVRLRFASTQIIRFSSGSLFAILKNTVRLRFNKNTVKPIYKIPIRVWFDSLVALPLSIGRNTRNPNFDITLVLDGQTLNSTTSARYLEVIIDDHLPFKSHINRSYIDQSSRKQNFTVCRSYSEISYYLPYNTLIILYYTLIQSHLLYALPVWASTSKTYLLKLKKTSKRSLKNHLEMSN